MIIHRWWSGGRVPHVEDVGFGVRWSELGYEVREHSGLGVVPSELLPYRWMVSQAGNEAQRSDVARIMVVYMYGGIYADFDVEPLRPLEDVSPWYWLDVEGRPSQWFFAAPQGFEPLLHVLEVCASRWHLRYPASTAPKAWSAAFPGVSPFEVLGVYDHHWDARSVPVDRELFLSRYGFIHHWRGSWLGDR